MRTRVLSLDSELGRDLGLDGDDAEAFLLKFSTEFHVDFTGFQFGDYFGPEAFDPIGEVVRLVRRGKLRSRLTLRDLAEAARNGRMRAESREQE